MDKTFDDDEFLWSQFIRLGEMLGDGDCDHKNSSSSNDAWVGKEYKRVARQLGLIKNKPRKNNSKQIDEFMEKRIVQVKCHKCNGELKQSRKGSLVGICVNCGAKFTLGKRRR